MIRGNWTEWPSREALSREGVTRARRMLARTVRVVVVAVLVWTAVTQRDISDQALILAPVLLIACVAAAWAFFRTTLEHRLWPSLGLLAFLVAVAVLAQWAGFIGPAIVLWCGCAVSALERLPLAASVPATAVALTGFALVNDDAWLTTAVVAIGLCLSGYVLRLDAEARGARSGPWRRSAPRVPPRPSRLRSPSGRGSRARSTTSSRTASPPSSCISRPPGSSSRAGRTATRFSNASWRRAAWPGTASTRPGRPCPRCGAR